MIKEKVRKVELTKQEKDIIAYISYGYTDNEICEKIKVTNASLRSRLSHMFNRTGTINRQHLVAWALRNKIIN
jgi:DNA-binding CsgD family transcriptional regulator